MKDSVRLVICFEDKKVLTTPVICFQEKEVLTTPACPERKGEHQSKPHAQEALFIGSWQPDQQRFAHGHAHNGHG
jgi:hypothetical protein